MSEMDATPRFQTRVRAESYVERERNAMPHDDSGTDSEPLINASRVSMVAYTDHKHS
jgi:hypothetical protein